MSNVIPTVSQFEGGTDLVAGVSTLKGSSNQFGQNFSFSNRTCGGDGSVTYEWRKSLNNPFSYGGVASTSINYSPLLSDGTWYIKLTATSSAGQVSSKVVEVVAESCGQNCDGSGGPIPKLIPITEENEDNNRDGFILNNAYPNPFNPTTNVSFELEENQNVSIDVYDIDGRFVKNLTNEMYTKGFHNVLFDATGLSSGTYIVRVQAGVSVKTQSIILIK